MNIRSGIYPILVLISSSFPISSPSGFALAAVPYEEEVAKVPQKPSSPPALARQPEPDIPHCARYFLYNGKKYECDSQLGSDAAHLRPIMSDVPAAIAELDAYVRTKKQVRIAAYAGSLGILAVIVGGLVSQPLIDQNGTLKTGGYITYTGIGIVANALIYGFSMLKANEQHLGKAIDYYNAAHPTRPIQLQFSTEVHF